MRVNEEVPESNEPEVQEMENRLNAIHQCAQWISSLSMLDESGVATGTAISDMVDFRYSSLSNNMGLFAKKHIAKGAVLVSLPQGAILRESHALVQSSAALIAFIDQVMNSHVMFVNERSKSISQHDFYKKRMQGRILGPPEIRMIVLVAIVLYAVDEQVDSTTTNRGGDERFSYMDKSLSSDLVKLSKHWSTFFNTWPKTFDSLPMFWNEQDYDNIRGTCHHAYVSRVRQDVNDSWSFVIQPALKQAGFKLPESGDGISLPLFYQRAVGATYSRSHGSVVGAGDSLMSMLESVLGGGDVPRPDPWLCPLLDCVNGARDDNDINIEMGSDDHGRAPIQLRSLRSLESGEELIISYEDMPNKDYFAKFGFVPLRRGQPVLHRFDMVALLTPRELVPHETDPRWRKLDKFGFSADHLKEESYFARTFALIANDDDMTYYRRLPETAEWLEGHPCKQISTLINFAYGILANEKELMGIKQDPWLEPWEAGVIVVKILDHALGQLSTPSNEHDANLLQSTTHTGNQRMGTYIRMLDRELLLKWRHAICTRNFLYEYEEAEVTRLPPFTIPNISCKTCWSSFRLKKCTQCQVTYYCCVQCQREDRREHKQFCRQIEAVKKDNVS